MNSGLFRYRFAIWRILDGMVAENNAICFSLFLLAYERVQLGFPQLSMGCPPQGRPRRWWSRAKLGLRFRKQMAIRDRKQKYALV